MSARTWLRYVVFLAVVTVGAVVCRDTPPGTTRMIQGVAVFTAAYVAAWLSAAAVYRGGRA